MTKIQKVSWKQKKYTHNWAENQTNGKHQLNLKRKNWNTKQITQLRHVKCKQVKVYCKKVIGTDCERKALAACSHDLREHATAPTASQLAEWTALHGFSTPTGIFQNLQHNTLSFSGHPAS